MTARELVCKCEEMFDSCFLPQKILDFIAEGAFCCYLSATFGQFYSSISSSKKVNDLACFPCKPFPCTCICCDSVKMLCYANGVCICFDESSNLVRRGAKN